MKSRRGLSTVIGAVFFVIIFTTTIAYVTYDMNLLNNFSRAVVVKNQADADVNHEAFAITKLSINNNKFNITVQNSGNIPINMTRLWIQNKTDVSWGTSKYVLNQVVYPGHTLTNIGQSLSLKALTSQGYDINLVTARGNTKEFFVNSVSQQPVSLQLFALPDTGPYNFNTTLLFAITNNMSNNNVLSNILPNMTVTPTGTTATLISGPSPASYPLLPNGDVAYFQWKYKISGPMGGTVKFQPSLFHGYLYNNATKIVTLSDGSLGQNMGVGQGVYIGKTNSNFQFKNVAPGSGIAVSSNATDVIVSAPALTSHFLVGQWDINKTWTGNIGTSFVDVYPSANANGNAIQIDTNGFTKYMYQIIWTKIGTGPQTCQLIDIVTGTNVMTTTSTLVTGMNTGSDTPIPPVLVNSIHNYKWQCKSITAADRPVWLAGRIWLKP